MVTEGIEFINAVPVVVVDHIKSVKTEKLEVSPSDLKVFIDGKNLMLQIMNKDKKFLPVRKSFLYKLLSWYSFSVHHINKVSPETLTNILNDFLLSIRADKVFIKTENGDAKTIVSTSYSDLPDIKVIEMCKNLKIESISRNDSFMRLVTEDRFKVQPIPGDECGVRICVFNSETGLRALEVNNFILRYVCTNGAVVSYNRDKLKVYHYGYTSETLNSKLNEFIEKTEVIKEKLSERLTESTKLNCDNLLPDIQIKLNSIVGRVASSNILRDVSGGASNYELFNLLTENAKQFDLYRRNKIEELAGDLISRN